MSTSTTSPAASSTPQPSSSAVPGGRVCDRCRWKKIKCDGARPCKNCRNANFPCESRVRLSKQATPRSYVQYLETRIKLLEQQKEQTSASASPDQASTKRKQETKDDSHHMSNPKISGTSFVSQMPSWPILRELGAHITDEEGFSRYIGPSGGIDFAAMVLQEVLPDDLPSTADFHSLFVLDDMHRKRELIESDVKLHEIDITELPDRSEAEGIVDMFFAFASRMFPILHRPSFDRMVHDLYSAKHLGPESMESLTQLHLVLSLGYCFEDQHDPQYRHDHQIDSLQRANKCAILIPHRRDGLVGVQTLGLKAYAYMMLRQRTEAMQVTSEAIMRATQCGLHIDGKVANGQFLVVEMRRRVFWCVFAFHVFHSALHGLPRSLHESDITISEPSDVDDEYLTDDEVLPSISRRTRIHRFIGMCRLTRLLSRTLDTLWLRHARKNVSTQIEQMNRMCCEHLLDQLNYSFTEIPNDLPESATGREELAIEASWAKEQLQYHYIRWLIQQPGVSLSTSDPTSAACLQASCEAAAALLAAADCDRRIWAYLDVVPSVHPTMIFIVALSPILHTTLLRKHSGDGPSHANLELRDLIACQSALRALNAQAVDYSDHVRQELLRKIMIKTYGEASVVLDPSFQEHPPSVDSHTREPESFPPEQQVHAYHNQYQSHPLFDPTNTQPSAFPAPMTFEEEVQQLNNQNEMRDLVNQSFSHGPWMMGARPNPDEMEASPHPHFNVWNTMNWPGSSANN